MKLKFSLDPKSIKKFLLSHVEKFVFAATVVCLLLFSFKAIGRGGIDWTPEDLGKAAERAEAHIQSTLPEAVESGADFLAKAGEIRDPITERSLTQPNRWTMQLWKELAKRGEPRLFPVVDLRANAGYGAFRVTRMGLASVEGQRWIVITGLIPVAKQREAFDEVFLNALGAGSARDEPSYCYYYVERAETDRNGNAEQLEWVSLGPGGLLKSAELLWGQRGSEIADQQYLAKLPPEVPLAIPMAFPLGQMTNKQWGPEVLHEPEIGRQGSSLYGVPGLVGTENPMEDPEDGQTEDTQPYDPFAAREMEVPLLTTALDEVEYNLFRFFDFNAEPGKFYRYRVRLLLVNPNYGVEPRFLERESLAVEQGLQTEWSEPTEPVSVARDSRLLVGTTITPTRLSTEPKATLMAIVFQMENGEELFEEFKDVPRGRLCNFVGKDPISSTPATYGGLAGLTADPTAADAEESFGFQTGILVLDIAGGPERPPVVRAAAISPDLTDPGRILMLGPDGGLFVQNDLDDLDEFERYLAPAAVTSGEADYYGDDDDDDDDDLDNW